MIVANIALAKRMEQKYLKEVAWKPPFLGLLLSPTVSCAFLHLLAPFAPLVFGHSCSQHDSWGHNIKLL